MTPAAPKVSIITPVYRSLEHIQDTITCLQNQTLQELEFIFIDDKGEDGTFDIVRKAAETDSRIVCLENEVNSGPGVARNKGIEAARGEFIAFVDADDILSKDFYEKLYNKAKETNALAVKGSLSLVLENGTEEESNLNQRIRNQLKDKPASMLSLWTYEHTAGIYSRTFILECGARNCETARRDQDTCFQMMAMLALSPDRFALEDSVYYYYVQHGASLVHRPRNAWFLEQMRLSGKFKVDFLMKNLDKKDAAPYLRMIIDLRLRILLEAELDSSVTQQDIDTYVNYFADTLKQWRSSSPETYLEEPLAQALRQMNYNAQVFHATGKWYLQHLETQKKLNELQWKINQLLPYSQAMLRRKLLLLRIKRLFAFGKRKQKYKQAIKDCKTHLRTFS